MEKVDRKVQRLADRHDPEAMRVKDKQTAMKARLAALTAAFGKINDMEELYEEDFASAESQMKQETAR